MLTDKQAQNMMQSALKAYKKRNNGKIDISKLARGCGLSYSNFYNPLFLGRKPNAEIWLKIMEGLGALSIREEGILIKKVG